MADDLRHPLAVAAVSSVLSRWHETGAEIALAAAGRKDRQAHERVGDPPRQRVQEGDDYAARLYLSFRVDDANLDFAIRARLAVARALRGPDVPDADLTYVWDNRQPVGTVLPNAYTERARMFFLEGGPSGPGAGWTSAATWPPTSAAPSATRPPDLPPSPWPATPTTPASAHWRASPNCASWRRRGVRAGLSL